MSTDSAIGHEAFQTTVEKLILNQKLVVINAKDALPKVFHTLITNNIYSAPVCFSGTQDYLGFIDLLDIISFIVQIFDEQQQQKQNNPHHQTPDLYDLLEQVEKFDKEHATRVIGLANRNQIPPLPVDSTIAKAMELFTNSGAHRVAIVKDSTIVGVLTQSSLVSWLNKQMSHLPSNLRKSTVADLGVGIKPVVCINFEKQSLDAFRLMAEHRIHGVAVTDENGCILSNLSAKDIKLLEPDALFTKMYRPVMELVQLTRINQLKSVYPSFCVNLKTTFQEAVLKFEVLKVHRLYIEDDNRKPIGVLSLGDVLNCLLIKVSP